MKKTVAVLALTGAMMGGFAVVPTSTPVIAPAAAQALPPPPPYWVPPPSYAKSKTLSNLGKRHRSYLGSAGRWVWSKRGIFGV